VGVSSNRPALNGTERTAGRRVVSVRRAAAALSTFGLLFLAGCSESTQREFARLGLPEAASDRAPYIHDLWIGTWIAAGIIGVGVWGLIGWVSFRYRTNHNDMPRQTRYNLPMEIFYTLAPFVVIGVLFYYTILAQTAVQTKVANPDVKIDVVGQKWSWTFNYKEADNPEVKSDVWEAGTINQTPDLYLPVGKSVRFTLQSPDVIHSFWVPAFYEKLDVVPGRRNTFDVTPNKEGVFAGKCAELCGTYHSAMLFNVHIVPEADYNNYLKTLVARGQTGEAKGAKDADSVGTNAQFDQKKVGGGTR
jgi:cytochrome c oxidase subunit 2